MGLLAATIRMVATLADYIDHARLLVGGAPNCRASRQAEVWLLAAAIRMVAAAPVVQVDHTWLLVGGAASAMAASQPPFGPLGAGQA